MSLISELEYLIQIVMADRQDHFPTFSDDSPEEKEFDENLLDDYDDAFDKLMSPEFNPLIDSNANEEQTEAAKAACKTIQFKPVKVFKHNVKQINPNSEK